MTVPEAGTYDVWVNFWGKPTTGADWRIKAGLSVGGMQLFRQMACKEVEPGDYTSASVLSGGNNTFLYQAYAGRVQVSTDKVLSVFVDDEAIKVGTPSTLVGDVSRTWYDGISYAVINRVVSVSENPGFPIGFGLSQNYPNPFNPSTEMVFTLPGASNVSLGVYDILGNEVVSLVNGNVKAGSTPWK